MFIINELNCIINVKTCLYEMKMHISFNLLKTNILNCMKNRMRASLITFLIAL